MTQVTLERRRAYGVTVTSARDGLSVKIDGNPVLEREALPAKKGRRLALGVHLGKVTFDDIVPFAQLPMFEMSPDQPIHVCDGRRRSADFLEPT